MRARQIFEACLYAEDLEAAAAFYQRVLGLEIVSLSAGRGFALRCGDGVVLIFNPQRTRINDMNVPVHGCTGAGHLAFLAQEHELPGWRAHLQQCGVPIEREVRWPEGGTSLYFRDPAGNSLELAPPTLWGFAGRRLASE